MANQIGKGRLELIEVLISAGTSSAQQVPRQIGVTVTSVAGNTQLEQTSDALESVFAGSARWETWSPGVAAVGTSKHGIVIGASAIRLVTTGSGHYQAVES
jgi:hypothetical protein